MREFADLVIDTLLFIVCVLFWLLFVVTFPVYWLGLKATHELAKRRSDGESGE